MWSCGRGVIASSVSSVFMQCLCASHSRPKFSIILCRLILTPYTLSYLCVFMPVNLNPLHSELFVGFHAG